MRWLTALIVFYIVGLLTFYTFAVFDTRAWDIAYFGWAKAFDAGVLAWGTLYHTLRIGYRDTVKWLFYFSLVRLVFDIQSFFTGIGVNNEFIVAALFLALMLIITALTWKEFKRIENI